MTTKYLIEKAFPFLKPLMDSPLYWNMPSRARYYSPKVVSIPVKFAGSEGSRADSAVKKLSALRIEVDEIEQRIQDEEVVDLMRRPESRERAKLIEGLMSLLFRLDSVRSVDPGVRDLRKATINKAIALQEAIDSIVGGDGEKHVDPTVEITENSNAWSSEGDSVLMQRMVEENKRVVGLMEQVVEKNKEQARLISSLSRRVEMLDKAFLCQKLRKTNNT